jgi:hypothetical protein
MPQGDGTGKFERTPEMRQQARDKSLAAIARRKAAIAAGENPVPAADKPKPYAPTPREPVVIVIGEIVTPPFSKLTQEVATTICKALANGQYASTACMAAGITYGTFKDWIRKGEQATEGPYRVFYDAATQAAAYGEMEMVEIIRDAATRGPQFWASAAWYLERVHPDRYGKQNRVELITRTKIVEIANRDGLDANELEAVATRLAIEAGGIEPDAD